MLTPSEKAILSPRDLYDAERAADKKEKQREEEFDQNNEYHAALKAADIDGPVPMVKGRLITNRGRAQARHEPEKQYNLMDFMLAAGAACNLKKLYETFEGLTATFGLAKTATTAAAATDPRIHQSAHHDFGIARVSAQTQRALEQEANILSTRVAALEGIDDHAVRRVEEEKIADLAAEFDMILHPKTGQYVHNATRVAAVEMVHNPMADARRCTHTVCVYRVRPQEGVDSKGIRVVVGDVVAQDNPAEVVVSGQHIAPALKIS